MNAQGVVIHPLHGLCQSNNVLSNQEPEGFGGWDGLVLAKAPRRQHPTSVVFVAVLEQGGGKAMALQQPVDLGAVAPGQARDFADLAAGEFQEAD